METEKTEPKIQLWWIWMRAGQQRQRYVYSLSFRAALLVVFF